MARLPEVALSQNPSGAGPFISSRSVQWATSCPLLLSRGRFACPRCRALHHNVNRAALRRHAARTGPVRPIQRAGSYADIGSYRGLGSDTPKVKSTTVTVGS